MEIEPLTTAEKSPRQSLGLEPDWLTGLVLFCGYGSKVMLEIAQQLESFGQKLQLIFTCGRNEELATQLQESQGSQRRFITAFTKDILCYMHLSDFFSGKPGPGSLSEAITMNLPVIVRNLSTPIRERYNPKWVEENKMGLVIPSFRQIGKAVEQFLQPDALSQTSLAKGDEIQA